MLKQAIVILISFFTASVAWAVERPLRILLVNDDGCRSIGATLLQERLAALAPVDTDTDWLNRGYITWTLFKTDRNAPQFEEQYRQLFAGYAD